jgi:hypothetical protein
MKNQLTSTSVAAQHCPILSCKAGAVIESDLPFTGIHHFKFSLQRSLAVLFSAIFFDAELRGVIGLVDGSQSSSHLLAFTVGGQKSMQIEQ